MLMLMENACMLNESEETMEKAVGTITIVWLHWIDYLGGMWVLA
jgi:hypothetical protein